MIIVIIGDVESLGKGDQKLEFVKSEPHWKFKKSMLHLVVYRMVLSFLTGFVCVEYKNHVRHAVGPTLGGA